MTKSDYIEIANILNNRRCFYSEFRRKKVIEAFCKFLKSNNSCCGARFDEDKFKIACGADFTEPYSKAIL